LAYPSADIGLRSRDQFSIEIATSTRPIFNDEWLAGSLRQH
jgi:hypothetical protein